MLRALLLSMSLIVVTLSAQAADEPTKTEPKPPEPFSIEVYRLKNVDPNDAVQTFHALMAPGTARTPGTRPITGKGGRGTAGPGGTAVPVPDDGGTTTGSSASGFGRPTPASQVPTCRALGDPRTHSLIVRGTEKDQQLAADLVAILETPEGKPLPTLKAVKAFRLEHLDPTDLIGMLQVLDPTMTYRLAVVGRSKLLLAAGTDEQMKELADAVKKLDISADKK